MMQHFSGLAVHTCKVSFRKLEALPEPDRNLTTAVKVGVKQQAVHKRHSIAQSLR